MSHQAPQTLADELSAQAASFGQRAAGADGKMIPQANRFSATAGCVHGTPHEQ